MKIPTAELTQLYLFGSTRKPHAEPIINLEHYYNQAELDELELDTSFIKNSNSPNILHKLNCDWDTGRGSFRNSSIALFDAFFSSLGSQVASACPDAIKIILSAKTLLLSLALNHTNFASSKQNIAINTFAGRLIRSPLHILDALFSVSGQTLSSNPFFKPLALGLSVLGLGNSFVHQNQSSVLNPEIHYQNLPGTIGRSAMHQISSCLSKWLNDLCQKNLLINSLLALGSALGLSVVPKTLREHEISWKNLDGLLAQNIFHLSDSVFASLGTHISKLIQTNLTGKLSLLGTITGIAGLSSTITDTNLRKFLDQQLIFTKVDSKFYRSIMHCFDSIVFNLGNQISESKTAPALIMAYIAAVMSGSRLLPSLTKTKIPMNTYAGLIQRLPFDFIEALISSTSNRLANQIPPILGLLAGPALSFRLGELFKDRSTQFNSLEGLLNKHMIHFWDNLMSSAGYKMAQKVTGGLISRIPNSKGSILADGKWITADGRIVPRMALGQQL